MIRKKSEFLTFLSESNSGCSVVNILFYRYVLNAYEYDDSEFQGPPRNLPRDEVFNLFGKFSKQIVKNAP